MKFVSMKETPGSARSPITALSYGASRSGKTRFAATFPKPLILAEASEGGYKTIQTMPREDWYDPKVEPRVALITSADDYTQAIAEIPAMIKGGAVETIVTDSLTFYHDLYLHYLVDKGFGVTKQGADDMRKVYGEIARHLRDIRIRVHGFNVNVVWLCLDTAPDEQHPLGGPMLSGQSRTKFSAGCGFLFYHRQVRLGKNVHWELHTANYGPFPAGGRDSGRLPQIIKNPTYRLITQYLDGARSVEEQDDVQESTPPSDGDNEATETTLTETTAAPTSRGAAPLRPVPRPVPAPVARR